MVGFGFMVFSATFNNISVISWPQKYEDDHHKEEFNLQYCKIQYTFYVKTQVISALVIDLCIKK